MKIPNLQFHSKKEGEKTIKRRLSQSKKKKTRGRKREIRISFCELTVLSRGWRSAGGTRKCSSGGEGWTLKKLQRCHLKGTTLSITATLYAKQEDPLPG